MSSSYDVVIVGGGIAGSALATRLAREGLGVLVLEKQLEYRDRVRGEAMLPWGVVELRRLGLYDVLIESGARHTTRWIQYDEGRSIEESEKFPLPVGDLLPDARPLNMGHPAACAALARAAVEAGAHLVRGISDVQLTAEPHGVAYRSDGASHEATARLVVGADGRRSIVREQAGIPLRRQEPTHMIAGLLIDPRDPVPDHDVIAIEGEVALLYFVQPGDRVRVYIAPSVEQRSRYTGRHGTEAFLAALRLGCLPTSDALAGGRSAGPCATYPGDETWTEEPFADAIVLVGDAAGYNSPILGQGLSLAMRDVRIVAELLVGRDGWGPELFREYAEERRERMRRVRVNANLLAATFVDFGPEAVARRAERQMRRASDPVLLQGLLSAFTGPESAPAEAFSDDAIERILDPSAT